MILDIRDEIEKKSTYFTKNELKNLQDQFSQTIESMNKATQELNEAIEKQKMITEKFRRGVLSATKQLEEAFVVSCNITHDVCT